MLRPVRLITIAGLRPCPELSEFVLTSSVFDSLSSVDINDGNAIPSLTGHALYDVWKTSVHEKIKLAFSKKTPLWEPFSKTCAYGGGKRPLRVEGSLK